MNLLEQKIRKQMIDESVKGFLGKAFDTRVGRFVKDKGKKAATGFMDPEGKGGGLSARAGRLVRVGGRKAAGADYSGAASKAFDVVKSVGSMGIATGIHAAVGRLSGLADQALQAGEGRVGPTSTPFGAKSDVERGESDVKKAINPLRAAERSFAPDAPTDFEGARKILGRKADDDVKTRDKISQEFDTAKMDIETDPALDDIKRNEKLRQVDRERRAELGQFDQRVIDTAIQKQKRGIRSQIAALAGGETEAEKAAQFLRYLDKRNKGR